MNATLTWTGRQQEKALDPTQDMAKANVVAFHILVQIDEVIAQHGQHPKHFVGLDCFLQDTVHDVSPRQTADSSRAGFLKQIKIF